MQQVAYYATLVWQAIAFYIDFVIYFVLFCITVCLKKVRFVFIISQL